MKQAVKIQDQTARFVQHIWTLTGQKENRRTDVVKSDLNGQIDSYKIFPCRFSNVILTLISIKLNKHASKFAAEPNSSVAIVLDLITGGRWYFPPAQ